jgi:hypothetical protein
MKNIKIILSFIAAMFFIGGYAQTAITSAKPELIKTEITYSALNKPSHPNMQNIEDWLIQFTLVCDNEVYYYDAEVARLYGESDPRDVHGRMSVSTKIYKEGIVLVRNGEYEGASYELFIPLLKMADVKKIADRLCKNMGGCIRPEEMEIQYEQSMNGVNVYWGGGC